MLFEIAVVLSTSAAAGQVAEAFAVPETSTHVVIASAPRSLIPELLPADNSTSGFPSPAGFFTPVAPDTAVGPVVAIDPQLIPRLAGLPLLQQLGLLPVNSLSKFVVSNPGVVRHLIDSPPAARDVDNWWAGLSSASKKTFVASAPELVGNLNGVPFGIRDEANHQFLSASIAQVKAEIAHGAGRSEIIDRKRQLHMLDQIELALVAPIGEPARHLLSLDTNGYGTAAIVIGDLATADYVSYLIPGMFFTVDGQIVDWAASAQNFQDAERGWLQTVGDHPTASIATVAWLGYQTPSLVDAGSLTQARTGRDAIAHAILGLQDVRAKRLPFTSIIAHSYGSTAAMMALSDYNIQVDALGLVGSPGSASPHASDLNVKGDNVYAGEADWDPIPNSAYFGSDPGSPEFGGHVFAVGGGVDPITHVPLLGSTGHNEYFSPGTESVRNLALVAIGEGKYVTSVGGHSATLAISHPQH